MDIDIANKMSDTSEYTEELPKENVSIASSKKSRKTRVPRNPLPMFYAPDTYKYEIGIDEAGRGPLFGRLYVAAVVLPKDGSMDTSGIRDSKKISKRQLPGIYHYIIENALCYHIAYIEASEIDEINIREAVIKAMHLCAKHVINKLEKMENASKEFQYEKDKYFLMVDGNDFPPYYHSVSGNDHLQIVLTTYFCINKETHLNHIVL